uniref:Uncharacterized protein n=1 Tax=Caenorhabditis japonica TaxID=281687 RepID=A0A8R1EFY1_CAEJA
MACQQEAESDKKKADAAIEQQRIHAAAAEKADKEKDQTKKD